jgi:hypothetical protein
MQSCPSRDKVYRVASPWIKNGRVGVSIVSNLTYVYPCYSNQQHIRNVDQLLFVYTIVVLCTDRWVHQGKLDIVFIVDASESVQAYNPPSGNNDNWATVLDFVVSVISSLQVSDTGVHVGVVKFGEQAVLEFAMGAHNTTDSAAHAVQNIYHSGGSANIPEALRTAREQFEGPTDRPDVQNFAVLIIGGVPIVDSDKLRHEIEQIRKRDIPGIAFLIGNYDNSLKLDAELKIVFDTYHVASFHDLHKHTLDVTSGFMRDNIYGKLYIISQYK